MQILENAIALLGGLTAQIANFRRFQISKSIPSHGVVEPQPLVSKNDLIEMEKRQALE